MLPVSISVSCDDMRCITAIHNWGQVRCSYMCVCKSVRLQISRIIRSASYFVSMYYMSISTCWSQRANRYAGLLFPTHMSKVAAFSLVCVCVSMLIFLLWEVVTWFFWPHLRCITSVGYRPGNSCHSWLSFVFKHTSIQCYIAICIPPMSLICCLALVWSSVCGSSDNEPSVEASQNEKRMNSPSFAQQYKTLKHEQNKGNELSWLKRTGKIKKSYMVKYLLTAPLNISFPNP